MISNYCNSCIPLHSHRDLYYQRHSFAVHNGSGGPYKSVTIHGECDRGCPNLIAYPPNTAFNITQAISTHIMECLTICDVVLEYSTDINIQAAVNWGSNYSLTLRSQKSITLSTDVSILNNGTGTLKLMSGMENKEGVGTVVFEEGSSISAPNGGEIEIYYNPLSDKDKHKYHNPYDYSEHVTPETYLTPYMLVNNLQDLGDIILFPSGNYALSQDVYAPAAESNFIPIFHTPRQMSFYGNFDGNKYSITGLRIIGGGNNTGLFRNIVGSEASHVQVKNLIIADSYIEGDWRVGVLAGNIAYADLENIHIRNVTVSGSSTIGLLSGSLAFSNLKSCYIDNTVIINITNICIGGIVGSTVSSIFESSLSLENLAGCTYDTLEVAHP